MKDHYSPPRRPWRKKFADAFHGVWRGVRGQSSFAVHCATAIAVACLAAWLQVSVLEWCILVLCIGLVMTAELFNSALEILAKAIDRRHNPLLGEALDIASGAVLLAAMAASLVGAIIFLPHLWRLVANW